MVRFATARTLSWICQIGKVFLSRSKARQSDDGQPRGRVILLGASNATRGLSTIISTVRNLLGGPVEILAAVGKPLRAMRRAGIDPGHLAPHYGS